MASRCRASSACRCCSASAAASAALRSASAFALARASASRAAWSSGFAWLAVAATASARPWASPPVSDGVVTEATAGADPDPSFTTSVLPVAWMSGLHVALEADQHARDGAESSEP